MSCTKCKKQICGCKDSPMTTPTPCPPGIDCPDPPQCPEIWDAQCVIYNGDPIVELCVNSGESLNVVFQKMMLFQIDPGCVGCTSLCQSVFNLHSITVTSSAISIGWDNAPNATQYVVQYKPSLSATWTSSIAISAPNHTDLIGGLTVSTQYDFRVVSVNGNASPACSCTSLTIRITTLTP